MVYDNEVKSNLVDIYYKLRRPATSIMYYIALVRQMYFNHCTDHHSRGSALCDATVINAHNSLSITKVTITKVLYDILIMNVTK